MPRFASGKNAYGISDRSGFRYRLREMREEWNGMLVGPDEYEEKHPQLKPPHIVSDPQALRNPRPERTEPKVEVLLNPNSFTSGSSGSSVITVREPGHGRTTADTVRFRKMEGFDGFTKTVLEVSTGYAITVTTSDEYTITVSGQSATVGSQRGGGDNATAGPTALEA